MSTSAEPLQKGRYSLNTSLGSGSVYPALDTISNTSVLVKEIVVRLNKVTTLSQQENSRRAFENAARKISDLRHDALLQVADFYSEVGRQYLVLENVEGEDLQEFLQKNGVALPVEKVLDWADQLLDAVNYLHNQKIIHKSICPRNVQLFTNGRIKLLGLIVTDEFGNDLSTSISETHDGTLNFSPLELIWDSLDSASQKVIVSSYDERSERTLKEPPDARSDLYSIGATLYYLLTRRIPVDPLERSIEILEGKSDPLPSPNEIDSGIAPEISEVVMRSLAIKRESRYDSAMIMRQILRTAVVRAKEREAMDKQELDEAAEILRHTQQLKLPAGVINANGESELTPADSVHTEPSQAEIVAQKLRKAEEMRLEAERLAAEAELLLREKEADLPGSGLERSSKIDTSSESPILGSDDDLLGLTTEPLHISDPPSENVSTADEIHLSIKPEPRAKIDLRELARASEPAKTELFVESSSPEEEDDAYLLHDEPAVEDITSLAPTADSEPTFSAYSYEYDRRRSGPPIPMIAGALAVLLIAAVAGYIFLGGSSAAAPETQGATVPQPQTAVEMPAQATQQEPEKQPEQQVSAFSDTETNPADTTPAEPPVETPDPRPAAKPVQTAKAKPNPDAAKKPAPVKKVTVDDLINDN